MSFGGIEFTGHGAPVVAGLEWMGARAYDPAARGFLSVDPLAPIVGAAWAGNPYSYAGNDPLRQMDPLGLSPVTDPEIVDLERKSLEGLSWIDTILTALGAPSTLFDMSGTSASHTPAWLRSVVKFSRFVPWLGIPVTIALFFDARERGDIAGQWNYGVSVILDVIPPLAPIGLLWDIVWTVVPPIVDWWNTDVRNWINRLNDPRTWFDWISQVSYGSH